MDSLKLHGLWLILVLRLNHYRLDGMTLLALHVLHLLLRNPMLSKNLARVFVAIGLLDRNGPFIGIGI